LDSIDSETHEQVKELEAQIKSAKVKIDERLLLAYSRIRSKMRNGLAVVTIQRDACSGCFNRIPPQRQSDVRLGRKLVVCEYCGRILVPSEE
jgi:predicted  nucleic acid-binding Zn-ribbon protein